MIKMKVIYTRKEDYLLPDLYLEKEIILNEFIFNFVSKIYV